MDGNDCTSCEGQGTSALRTKLSSLFMERRFALRGAIFSEILLQGALLKLLDALMDLSLREGRDRQFFYRNHGFSTSMLDYAGVNPSQSL